MAKDESGISAISEESIGYLEDVKKGKPRKFAMICKGTSVISLVVYKKGNVEKHKKEAKQSGKGQFYFGVVDGKGLDIRFVLARTDGFESAPVKSTSLKGFLDESAELKCRPYFEIVDASPLVLDEEDPLVARFLKLQEPALQACEAHPDRAAEINALCLQIGGHLDQEQPDQATPKLDELESLLGSLGGAKKPTSSVDDSGLEAKLVEALKAFKPLLDKAILLHPDRKAELIASVMNVRDEIKNKQYGLAQTDVTALGQLLNSLVNATESTSNTSAMFNERLKALLPAIKAAIGTPIGDQAKSLVSEAAGFAGKKDFAQANQLLDQVQELLNKGKSTAAAEAPTAAAEAPQAAAETQKGATEPAADVKHQERFEAAKMRIEPKLQEACKAKPEKNDALLKIWNFALDQALDGNLTSANAAMEKLETAITKLMEAAQPPSGETQPPAPSGSAPVSNVALQQSLLAWDAARKQMEAELQTFEQQILGLFSDDLRLPVVKQNIRKLDVVLGDYAEELRDRLDDAYNAPVEYKPGLCAEALVVLNRYRAYLNTDPFIKAVARNRVKPIDIEGVLGKTLDAVAKNLGG